MNNQNCLFCYESLETEQRGFHPRCSRKMFGSNEPPVLDYTSAQMLELAEKVIRSHISVTGVQPKLSLGIQRLSEKSMPKRLTIMGVMGTYILKPPSTDYRNLPEIEDVTMHLAAMAGIPTVPHTLIPFKSGELAYLTKRVDRSETQKFAMEDFCQLTDKPTESKYRGSYEQIGKAILQYSSQPVLDVVFFFEQVLFCFLTGNNDMHLKNFSLLNTGNGYKLCPVYDMVAAQLVLPSDTEELALTLNGKKKKLNRTDFESAMKTLKLDDIVIQKMFARFEKSLPKWRTQIEKSFLPFELQQQFHEMILRKSEQIGLKAC